MSNVVPLKNKSGDALATKADLADLKASLIEKMANNTVKIIVLMVTLLAVATGIILKYGGHA